MSSPKAQGGGDSKKPRIGETPMECDVGGDGPVRGRGGFRQAELRTIPPNITQLKTAEAKKERQIDVLANYVNLMPMPNRVVHMYRIDYEPQVESASLMRFLFKHAAAQKFQREPIFDGAHECRSGQKLDQNETHMKIADNRDNDREYTVKFVHTGTASYGPELLRIYNMHMKDFLKKMGYHSPQIGIFVHPNHAAPVNPDIMLLRGFRTAANVHENNRMMMNLEGAHKLMQKKNVLMQMNEIKNRLPPGRNLPEALRDELVGKVVVTAYDRKGVYRIEDVDFSKNPNSSFDMRGQPKTFIEYYKEKYHLSIQDAGQPLLKVVHNNQRKREGQEPKETLVVPELCNIAGLTTAQRNDTYLRRQLITASQIPPNDRVQQMRTFLETFHSNTEIRAQLSEWGYDYDKDAVRLKAHVIPPTKFAIGSRTQAAPKDWPAARADTADIVVNQLAVAPKLKKIAVINSPGERNDMGGLLQTLKNGMDSVGLQVGGPPHRIEVNSHRADDYVKGVCQVPPDCEMAIVILQSQNKERYDAIKKAASIQKGLITQVVTARLLKDERKNKAAAVKIGIQIAAKVGGEPWWVDIPLKGAMICGYDTYHDTTKRGRSYGAFIASLNNNYSRWWSKADAHDRLEEVSAQISTNMSEALQTYKKFNANALPNRVIIYRDGVGEGQLDHVYRVELTRIRQTLEAIDKNIRLTFIVVSKRIGARFYMRAGQNDFRNPPPGTVIDHTVTRQERYDFYLISQKTGQGSVTPTYYNIIFDQSGFSPDIHQQMAFKLCLLYYNWSGTVRVPAPCQYAHKLALLCGEHLHGQPNAVMDAKLHFL